MQENADAIVRITADCPLIDGGLLDQVISLFINNDLDYCSNREPETYPDGLDLEVIRSSALQKHMRMLWINLIVSMQLHLLQDQTSLNRTVYKITQIFRCTGGP